jgi:AcrR family transcriptional regulator
MAAGLEAVMARAVDAAAEPDGDEVAERILDAALDQVAAYGVRRTTVDEVARRAGVGRMTVFRRFKSKDALMEQLALREARRFLAALDAAADGICDPVERIVETFVAALGFADEHPLLSRLTRVDPETVLAILRTDDPPLMTLARRYVATQLADVPRRDVDLVAEAFVRIGLSFVLVPGGPVPPGDPVAARAFARASLAPLAS